MENSRGGYSKSRRIKQFLGGTPKIEEKPWISREVNAKKIENSKEVTVLQTN